MNIFYNDAFDAANGSKQVNQMTIGNLSQGGVFGAYYKDKDGTYHRYGSSDTNPNVYRDKDGKLVGEDEMRRRIANGESEADFTQITYGTENGIANSLAFLEGVNNGTIIILNEVTGEEVSLSSSTGFTEGYYTDDDAAAEAEYKRETASIQVKEKRLQMELNQIEAQQKACDTEIDSVKKVMDKNIDRTFKVFS